ncbi:MAG TPA: hypothetical protein VIS74_04100 [Chthoniobacterales bacterium]
MNTLRISLLSLLIISAIGMARGESFAITADSLSAAIPAIKTAGLEWMFLPHKQPFDPKAPQLPFDSGRPLRGVFTPAQFAVTARALSSQNLAAKNILSTIVDPAARLDIPSVDGTNSRTVSLSATSLPDNKILVRTYGSDLSIAEEAAIEPGQTIVLSTAGETSDRVSIYFITIKKG